MPEPSTRQRILDAAIAEFAEHGYAGARIDRIASAAQANKERIYANFGDKRALFREVTAQLAAKAWVWRSESAGELPDAAGELFDAGSGNPELMRLLNWRRLDPDQQEPDQAELDDIRRKLDDIRAAQADGLVDATWDPTDILAIISALAASWNTAPAALIQIAEETGTPVTERRSVIEEATRRMFAPRSGR